MAYNQRQPYAESRPPYNNYQERSNDEVFLRGFDQDHERDGYGYGNEYWEQNQQGRRDPTRPNRDPSMYNYDSWVSDPKGHTEPKSSDRGSFNDDFNQELSSNQNGLHSDPNRLNANWQKPRSPVGTRHGRDHYGIHPAQGGRHPQNNYGDQSGDRGNPWQHQENPESYTGPHRGRNYRDQGEDGGGGYGHVNGIGNGPSNDSGLGRPSTRDGKHRPSPFGHADLGPPAQSRGPSARRQDDPKSPDTLSWDNPFPTFPSNSRISAQSETASRSRSRPGEGRRPVDLDNRPPTAPEPAHYISADDENRYQNGGEWGNPPQDPNGRPARSRIPHSDTNHSQRIPYDRNGSTETHGKGSGPASSLGHRQEEISTGGWTQQQETARPTYDRSRTMPAAVSHPTSPGSTNTGQEGWQEPGAVAGYFGPEDRGYLPNGSQRRTQPRTDSDESKAQFGHRPVPQRNFLANPRVEGEGFRGNYSSSNSDHGPIPMNGRPNQQYRDRSSEEVPNFANAQNGMSSGGINDHFAPPSKPQSPAGFSRRGPSPGHNEYLHGGLEPFPRSRSQPDVYDRRSPRPADDNRFDFGINELPDQRPATSASNNRSPPSNRAHMGPPRTQYGDPRQTRPLPRPPPTHQLPAPPVQGTPPGRVPRPGDRPGPSRGPSDPQSRRINDLHQPRGQTGPQRDDQLARGGSAPPGRTGPSTPPGSAPGNPDSLPFHPAPVRPGLNESSQMHNKPPPVRNYSDNSSTAPNGAPTPPPKGDKRVPKPVTYNELDRLRQKVNANPDDQETRFTLAKKLVEASTVLVDEKGDPRARTKAKEDYTMQASKIFKKLAANGHTESMFYLGDCYSRGSLGLVADVKEAFTFYQSAAKANHAQAAYRVAVCCEIGQDEGGGTRRDPLKAMQWYKRAAQLGDASGMYKMGIIQLKGLLGQPKNPKDALVWLQRAADRADEENPHALHELALLYQTPPPNIDIPKDDKRAKQLFLQSAQLGYKFSQFRLGSAYEYGQLGCVVDPRQSIAWYSKAAVQEEHQSELALSGWYLTGSEGVLQQSDTEAYLWARKAAQAGLAKAEYAMGYFTEVGIGAPSNIEDAKRWYWRAASQNFPKARERLEDLRKGGAVKQKARVSRSNMRKQSDGECIVM